MKFYEDNGKLNFQENYVEQEKELLLDNKSKSQDISKDLSNENSLKEKGYKKLIHESTVISIEITADTTVFDLYKGIFFMFLSCLFKSIYGILLKYVMMINIELSPFQVMAWRTYIMSIITLIVVFIFSFKKKNKLFDTNLASFNQVMWRSFLAVFSTPFTIVSLKYLSISEVYSIFYIYPAIIVFFYFITGKEKIYLLDYLCLISCFVGVLFIVKPIFMKTWFEGIIDFSVSNKYSNVNSNLRLGLFLLVISAAIIKASEDIIVKNTGKSVHPFLYVICYVILGIVFFPLLVFIFDINIVTLNLNSKILMIFISITCVIYIYFMALGFQNENAGRVSMINYLQVVLMFLTDLFYFGKPPMMADFIGTFLILSLNTINGFYKGIKRNEKLNKFKEKNEKKEEKAIL